MKKKHNKHTQNSTKIAINSLKLLLRKRCW